MFDIRLWAMAASVYQVARNLFAWARDNAKRTAQIQQAFDDSVSGGALTKGGLDSITSATKNGVTMSKMVGLNENDRQTALRLAVEWLSLGYAPGTGRSLGRF